MISLFISFFRLLKIIITGIKNDKDFTLLLVFILVLLTGSTIFYSSVEHWTILDAVYFSIMTMSTVGYGDLTPTTDLSKIFTIVYTCLSIGSFVSFTAKTVQIVLENHKSNKERVYRRINKK
ncbi:MAG: hypothetical protein CSA36_02090 [Draconibacterium sp.]|nr:MAG: hypothetical protein CSA36_02090 [Draconibacterium sp.]